MRILIWHVHAAWTTAFVAGCHDYVLPVLPDRGPFGRGRARTYAWPDTVVEAAPSELADIDVDVVVLQRPEEENLARQWLGRDVPAVYVEHNTPKGDVPFTRHPLADRSDITIIHVTNFNSLMWDCGRTATRVIEHGVALPTVRWTGELPRIAVVTNEPLRRGRVTGTDLIARFASIAPVDVYGIGVSGLAAPGVTVHEDPDQRGMHAAVARRRVYAHLPRWTSLGLSLIEAMHMGCPVVAVAATEVPLVVPAAAGAVSADIDELLAATELLIADPAAAARAGAAARAAAGRFTLPRFLSQWDQLLTEVAVPDQRWHPTHARTGSRP
ncbi:MAG TPA: glycosyltransferase [Micromonosporaceae bacterium]|jgi:glycosyltransferase involved in cell wall biosynthesis